MASSGKTRKEIRSGTVAVTSLDLTKAVTFASAMPSAGYRIAFERGSSVATVMSPSDKTVSGFTLNVSVGVTETVGYIAVED